MDPILSFITVAFIGGIAGYLGSLLITERMALVGGPLGHMALPGVALALVYGFDIFWGALGAVFIAAIIIWLLGLRSGLPTEALTAVVFASTVALGFLILPIGEAEIALIGDITNIGILDAVLAVFLGVGTFLVLRSIYPKMVLAGISSDLAKSENISIKKHNLIYLIAIALVVAMEVKIVGILLTAALMAIPAATAKNISKTLRQYTFLGCLLGAVSAVVGTALFMTLEFPAGPLIILTSTLFFLISLIFKRK